MRDNGGTSLFVSLSDVNIHFQCDNTSAVFYIKIFGGMCSIQMAKLVGEIRQWCLDRNNFRQCLGVRIRIPSL